MKKELLILSFLVSCSATGCLGHVASDAEYDPAGFDCEQAADLNADYTDALDQIGEIGISDTDCNTENAQIEIDELYETIENLESNAASSNTIWKLKYDGLLEQFRMIQDSYGVVVSEYREYKSLCELHGVWMDIEVDTEGGTI